MRALQPVPPLQGGAPPGAPLRRSRLWKAVVRLGCLLCPRGTYDDLLCYLREVQGDDSPDSAVASLRDALAHLKRHAALPLTGLVVLCSGMLLRGFTAGTLADNLLSGLGGGGLLIAALLVAPVAPTSRAGCPYMLEASPGTLRPRLLNAAKVAGPAGVVLMAAPMVLSADHPPFGASCLLGTVASGFGMLVVATGASRGRTRWFSRGVSLTAWGALLVAFGDAGWAALDSGDVVANVAAFTTAGGCLLYGLSARHLVEAYSPGGRGAQRSCP
jgi:hypothetical protein